MESLILDQTQTEVDVTGTKPTRRQGSKRLMCATESHGVFVSSSVSGVSALIGISCRSDTLKGLGAFLQLELAQAQA